MNYIDISESILPSDTLPLDTTPCDCESSCSNQPFCGHTIDLSDPDPVYLCNNSCPCPPSCPFRLPVPSVKLDVNASPGKGLGLFAGQYIPAQTYLGDYTGVIVNSRDHRKCESRDLKSVVDHFPITSKGEATINYVLTIREQSERGVLTTHIDATSSGSKLRFMNHSCVPNVSVIPMRDDWVVPRATCWTTRDVKSGEELGICYGDGEHLGKVVCQCGERECRGFLPLECQFDDD
eukprot:sb/3469239/